MTPTAQNIKATDLAEAWHSRKPERQAALALNRVLRKSRSPLSASEVLKLGRDNLAGLADLAKTTNAWAAVSDTDRRTIESALLPKVEHKVESLADLKDVLRPDELAKLPLADRLEILTGVSSQNSLSSADFIRTANFGQPVTPSTPTNTLAITSPPTAPNKRTVTPAAFAKMAGIDQHLFKQAGGIVEAEQMTRTQFNKLNPKQQSSFCKSGGQLTE